MIAQATKKRTSGPKGRMVCGSMYGLKPVPTSPYLPARYPNIKEFLPCAFVQVLELGEGGRPQHQAIDVAHDCFRAVLRQSRQL
jgi:hypothetical protein